MKYVLVLTILALSALAASAESVFLRLAIQPVPDGGDVSIGAMALACLGMVINIAWRCYSPQRDL
jgi:hypothetical protein